MVTTEHREESPQQFRIEGAILRNVELDWRRD